jgi:hypothetical protein
MPLAADETVRAASSRGSNKLEEAASPMSFWYRALDPIDALDARWPGMRDRLCDSRPAIRRHINIFIGGRRATLATRLAPGTDVFILTAISGG